MSNLAIPKEFSDKWWRINNLYYITNKNGDKVKFKCNAQQKELFDAVQNNKRHIILKARQIGITTFVAGIYFLDEILFEKNTKCLIITHTKDDSTKILNGKIYYALDNLPEAVAKHVNVVKRNTEELIISHDDGRSSSSITIGTSGRSGTYQFLHISEFGKICARFPEKAREIITGALPATENGVIFIESTAEGQSGRFHEMSMASLSAQRQGLPVNQRDYEFHFFAWHDNPEYIQFEAEVITTLMDKYFDGLLQNHNIELTIEQKYWYIATERLLQNDMKREHPSHADEAFEQAVEGAVYGRQFIELDKEQRILDIAHHAMSPVYTAWDIGRSDDTAIWFYQIKQGGWIDFIDYYEMNKADANHYVKVVLDKPYRYGKHYLPHDAISERADTIKDYVTQLKDAGLRDISIVPRTQSEISDIVFVRTHFAQMRFNKNNPLVMEGVKKLRNFQFAWNSKYGVWNNEKTIDNGASHCADALRYAIVSLPKDLQTLSSFAPVSYIKNPNYNPRRRV